MNDKTKIRLKLDLNISAFRINLVNRNNPELRNIGHIFINVYFNGIFDLCIWFICTGIVYKLLMNCLVRFGEHHFV